MISDAQNLKETARTRIAELHDALMGGRISGAEFRASCAYWLRAEASAERSDRKGAL